MNAVMAVTLRLPAELGERLFEVVPRGERNAWLVRAVELRLAEERFGPGAVGEFGAVERALSVADQEPPGSGGHVPSVGATPAEQPSQRSNAPANFSLANVTLQAAREFRPYPKGGKR